MKPTHEIIDRARKMRKEPTKEESKLVHFYNRDINKHIRETENTITNFYRERGKELGLSLEVEFLSPTK